MITPDIIRSVESTRMVTKKNDRTAEYVFVANRLHSYLDVVQSHYAVTQWDTERTMLKRRAQGMPSLGEIVAFLAEQGISRYVLTYTIEHP